MGVLETLILTTAIAGIGGTGLGGLVGAMLQKNSARVVSLLLSFAGGVMLSVVCFDLIIEAVETGVGVMVVSGAVALGVIIIYLLNYWIDRNTNPEVPHIDENHPKTADNLDELIHSDHYEQHQARHDNKFALFVAGMVMASAIALHNVPEGMTIGASYASNNGVMGSSALVLAVLITALSGVPTIIGALLGFMLGEIGPMGLAMSLGFASGAMLYVVFGEIFPQAILMHHSKIPAFSSIVGILVGLFIIFG